MYDGDKTRRKRKHMTKGVLFYLCSLIAMVLILTGATATSLVFRTRNLVQVPLGLEVNQIHTLMMGPDAMLNAGDVITIEVIVTNPTTNTSFENVTVFSTPVSLICMPGGIDNMIAIIQPNVSISCFAMFLISQNDIDSMTAFQVNVSVTTDTNPSVVVNTTETTPIVQTTFGELTVSQMHTLESPASEFGPSVGDVVTISTKVFNSGTETMLNVTCIGGSIVELLPMQMHLFQYQEALTLSNIQSGMFTTLENVTATGTTSAQLLVVETGAMTNLTLNGTAELTVNSVVMVDSLALPGDVVMFTVQVTNTGTLPISNIILTEDNPLGFTYLCEPMMVNNVIGDMFPMETKTCTAAYMLMTSDFQPYGDAINIVNVATATGQDFLLQNVAYDDEGSAPIDSINLVWGKFDEVPLVENTDFVITTGHTTWDYRLDLFQTWYNPFVSQQRTALTQRAGYVGTLRDLSITTVITDTNGLPTNVPAFTHTFSNFNVSSRHLYGVLFMMDPDLLATVTIVTDPPNLQAASSVVYRFPTNPTTTWNPVTGVWSTINANTPFEILVLNIGDLRNYNSFTVTHTKGDTMWWSLGEVVTPQ